MSGSLHGRTWIAVSALGPPALIGVVVAIGALGPDSLRQATTLILCQTIIVLGLQVFIGNSGVWSFGQLGLAAIGAYTAALCTLPATFATLVAPSLPAWIPGLHASPVAAALAAAALCAGVALVVAPALMRTSTLAIPISTFAFLIVVYNVLANWEGLTGGSGGLVEIPRTTGLLGVGAAAAAVSLLALAYRLSAPGYRLVASREDEVASRSLGIGVLRERTIAFALSGAICGLGGALAVHQSGILLPGSFYFAATVTTVTMLVVGGTGSVLGAVIGSLAVALVNEALHNLEAGGSLLGLLRIGQAPGLAEIGVGLILLAAMIALPRGLTGGREAGDIAGGLVRPGRDEGVAVDGPRRASRVRIDGGGEGLRAAGIAVAFGGLRVLDGVDLTLARGEVVGLIGPNGAGKTTLLNVLSGFQAPERGTVHTDGVEVGGLPPERLARVGLARTFQGVLPFSGLSGLEGVAVGAMGVGVPKRAAVGRAHALLAELGLGELARRRVGSLPAGRRRLLGIARALATAPRYLLLDEPAAGLDAEERRQLLALIETARGRLGCGVLLVEHELDVVSRACARVQVLDDGTTLRIGTPAEIQGDPAVAAAYLGGAFLVGADA